MGDGGVSAHLPLSVVPSAHRNVENERVRVSAGDDDIFVDALPPPLPPKG